VTFERNNETETPKQNFLSKTSQAFNSKTRNLLKKNNIREYFKTHKIGNNIPETKTKTLQLGKISSKDLEKQNDLKGKLIADHLKNRGIIEKLKKHQTQNKNKNLKGKIHEKKSRQLLNSLPKYITEPIKPYDKNAEEVNTSQSSEMLDFPPNINSTKTKLFDLFGILSKHSSKTNSQENTLTDFIDFKNKLQITKTPSYLKVQKIKVKSKKAKAKESNPIKITTFKENKLLDLKPLPKVESEWTQEAGAPLQDKKAIKVTLPTKHLLSDLNSSPSKKAQRQLSPLEHTLRNISPTHTYPHPSRTTPHKLSSSKPSLPLPINPMNPNNNNINNTPPTTTAEDYPNTTQANPLPNTHNPALAMLKFLHLPTSLKPHTPIFSSPILKPPPPSFTNRPRQIQTKDLADFIHSNKQLIQAFQFQRVRDVQASLLSNAPVVYSLAKSSQVKQSLSNNFDGNDGLGANRGLATMSGMRNVSSKLVSPVQNALVSYDGIKRKEMQDSNRIRKREHDVNQMYQSNRRKAHRINTSDIPNPELSEALSVKTAHFQVKPQTTRDYSQLQYKFTN
jgi:hypothetical protein